MKWNGIFCTIADQESCHVLYSSNWDIFCCDLNYKDTKFIILKFLHIGSGRGGGGGGWSSVLHDLLFLGLIWMICAFEI